MSIGRYKASGRDLRRVGGREALDARRALASGTGAERVGHRRAGPPAPAVQQAAEGQRGGDEGEGWIGRPRESVRGRGGARRRRRRRGDRPRRRAGGREWTAAEGPRRGADGWQAKRRGVRYSFLFMRADGAQLRQLTALIDAGHLHPVVDRTFPFDATLDAIAYVDQGRAKGKVVVTLD